MKNIIRAQLALMRANVSDIRIHVDTGGYATYGHRWGGTGLGLGALSLGDLAPGAGGVVGWA